MTKLFTPFQKICRYVVFTVLAYFSINLSVYAQAPQKFNYQGIARDAKGQAISSKTLALRLSVLPTEDATVAEYEETQIVTTNEFGLYTLQIGAGTVVNGEMKTVKWETGNKYIRVAIDPKGGTDYQVVGTSQLLSVPYAIYADKAGVARESSSTTGNTRAGNVITPAAGTGTINYLTKFTAANTIYNSQLFDNGTNVGLGTTTPAAKFHLSAPAIADMRITSNGAGAGDYATMQLFNNAGTSFGFTKLGAGQVGNYTTGIPRPHLALFANRGSMLYNATGNIAFATLIGATNFTRMFVDSATGNVGIGTSTPGAKLEVAGQVKITGGAPGAGKVLTSDASGLASWQNIGVGGIPWMQTGNNLSNTNTGNVSIGNTNALMRLQIADNQGKNLLLENPTPLALNTKSGLFIKHSNYYNAAMNVIGKSATTSRLGLFTGNYSTADSLVERLTIASNGSVGIGDTTPSYPLDVNGSINATGYMYATGLSCTQEISNNFQQNYGDSYVDGYFDVDGNVDFASNLHVAGVTTNDGNLNVGGAVDVTGEIKVSNGNGIVKSNSGTQLRMGFSSGGVAASVPSNGVVSATFNITAFSGTNSNIRVVGAQFQPNAGSGTGFTHFVITPHDVNDANNQVEVSFFNAGSTTASFDGVLYLLCVATD